MGIDESERISVPDELHGLQRIAFIVRHDAMMEEEPMPEHLIELRDRLLSEVAAHREAGTYSEHDEIKEAIASSPGYLRAYQETELEYQSGVSKPGGTLQS